MLLINFVAHLFVGLASTHWQILHLYKGTCTSLVVSQTFAFMFIYMTKMWSKSNGNKNSFHKRFDFFLPIYPYQTISPLNLQLRRTSCKMFEVLVHSIQSTSLWTSPFFYFIHIYRTNVFLQRYDVKKDCTSTCTCNVGIFFTQQKGTFK